MCLHIHSYYNTKLTAKTDILVYKNLEYSDCDFYTPYRHFPIHFINDKCILKINKKRLTFGMGVIYYGIHSYFDKYYLMHHFKKHYAVIPKGANFYIGNRGDVVSTSLLIFRTKKAYLEYKKSNLVDNKYFNHISR